jgi:hypothetical protein
MTTYFPMKKYKFVKFQQSNTKGKKYDAIIENRETFDRVIIPFGSSEYEQYKDSTGLGLYSNKDHNDKMRRTLYRKRHEVFLKPDMYSPGHFSYFFLWK